MWVALEVTEEEACRSSFEKVRPDMSSHVVSQKMDAKEQEKAHSTVKVEWALLRN